MMDCSSRLIPVYTLLSKQLQGWLKGLKVKGFLLLNLISSRVVKALTQYFDPNKMIHSSDW